jgi:hypothetical protein
VGYSYNVPSMMSGLATPFGEDTTDAIGLAFAGNGVAVAVMRSMGLPDAGTAGELHYARWNGSWTPGFGGVWPAVQPGLKINGGPSIAGSTLRAHCAFQGVDNHFYYAEFFNNAWSPTDEPVAVAGVPSTGPAPPAITTLMDTPIIVYVTSTGDISDQTRMGGTWQAPHAHGISGAVSTTPAVAALAAGPELLVVYTRSSGQDLMFTTRTMGTWSAPALIPGASSGDQVSLAPLAAGGAVLVWRGTDGLLYTSIFTAPASWTAPMAGIMGNVTDLQSPPVAATGASGAQAELLYLDTSFDLWSARMTNDAWGPPSMLGSASFRLAVATGN